MRKATCNANHTVFSNTKGKIKKIESSGVARNAPLGKKGYSKQRRWSVQLTYV